MGRAAEPLLSMGSGFGDSQDGRGVSEAELARGRVRRRLWLWMWLATAMWLGAFALLLTALIPIVIFVVLSIVVAIVAGVLNERIMGLDRRSRLGRCWRCGYDLRGTASPTRCPECGSPV